MSEKTTYWARKGTNLRRQGLARQMREAIVKVSPWAMATRATPTARPRPGEGKCIVNMTTPTRTSVKKWMRWHRRFTDTIPGPAA